MSPEAIAQGGLAAILALALGGFIWFKPAVDKLLERIDKAEAQRDSLLDTYRAEVLPALTASTTSSARIVDLVEKLVPLLERAP